MTVQDIIRKLHNDGKKVIAYDLFIVDDLDIDNAIYYAEVPEEYASLPVYDCEIPPAYVELGGVYDYIYFATKEDYIKAKVGKRVPSAFPRLCIAIGRNTKSRLTKDWKGHMWSEIPPIELAWAGSNGGEIPEVDIEGRFTRLRQPDILISLEFDKPFYYVKDDNGNDWAWLGNPMKDKVPDGLHLFDAKKEYGDRL